jgi:hypothetical protein
MNLVFFGIIIFIALFVLLSWLAKANSKKITKNIRRTILFLSIVFAILFIILGRFLFSLPLLLLATSIFKIKGLTTIQIFQLWRLLQYLRNSGRFSYYGKTNQAPTQNSLSIDEAYKILGLQKDCTKQQVQKAANNIQKKIHPDVSPETARLSALVNEARDLVLKNIS